ncbi:MAG: hypothetical protein ACTHZ5_03420 [Micrococcaceae bacterium]
MVTINLDTFARFSARRDDLLRRQRRRDALWGTVFVILAALFCIGCGFRLIYQPSLMFGPGLLPAVMILLLLFWCREITRPGVDPVHELLEPSDAESRWVLYHRGQRLNESPEYASALRRKVMILVLSAGPLVLQIALWLVGKGPASPWLAALVALIVVFTGGALKPRSLDPFSIVRFTDDDVKELLHRRQLDPANRPKALPIIFVADPSDVDEKRN